MASEQSVPTRILIAEDHPESRDALSTLLTAVGFRVAVAEDGRRALEAALQHPPDLILMDLMMPEMDGLTATRMLREQPGFPRIPILAVTAMEGAEDRAVEAGCNDFVPKPINVPVLLEKIRYWIAAQQEGAG